ncbi:MAG: aerial mycelium formation protein [Actinomycetota bacterium]|nr:aerial mycelium formation protein [Actinomycetota bacterium]
MDQPEGTYPGGNRRIDRVLAEDYLTGLSGRALQDVRQLRKEAEQEETDISYLRRMVEGRLDILRAEALRRSGGGSGSLVDDLKNILSDDGERAPAYGMGRHIAVEPSRADSHRRDLEALLADVDLSDVSARNDDELSAMRERLEAEDRLLSERRRAVQKVMDACSGEITRRYRDGEANVADLLADDATG